MTRRLAILENVPLAVISQSPYASTTRGTHFQDNPKHCCPVSPVHSLQLRHLRSDQHLKLRGCITLMSNAADGDSDQFGITMSPGLWLDQYHNLAPKEGNDEHDGKSQQYNHVCSCVVSPCPSPA